MFCSPSDFPSTGLGCFEVQMGSCPWQCSMPCHFHSFPSPISMMELFAPLQPGKQGIPPQIASLYFDLGQGQRCPFMRQDGQQLVFQTSEITMLQALPMLIAPQVPSTHLYWMVSLSHS